MSKSNKKKEKNLNIERLRELLNYCDNTGKFFWLTKSSRYTNIKVGDEAGTLASNGCIYIQIDGKKFIAHRLAWFYTYGVWPDSTLDHINGKRTDNRLKNLRDVPHRVNMQNKIKYKRLETDLPQGVIAIKRKDGSIRSYITHWRDVNSNLCWSPVFNVKKCAGLVNALTKAIEYREAKIVECNLEGASYSPRHGA